ncbi:MAG: hypothetical protein K5989_12935 [Lachnospiraceae bacterium]|nr:hypothetical protein [Lachnospiraceae bacterium]
MSTKETLSLDNAQAVYLGVKDYGKENVNKDTKADFRYRFIIDGKETALKVDPGELNENGEFSYPIQNQLKENYLYEITVKDDTVTAVTELPEEHLQAFEPVVNGIPGERTIANFLKTAAEPVGTTLYIYGGGWDWQDEGSSIQTRSIGVSPDWVKFFHEHDVNYTFKSKDGNEENAEPENSYYPYGGYNEYYYAGLDCSGYLGWILYNTFETQNGGEGYVGGSTGFAKRLSDKGFGEWTQDVKAPDGESGYEMKPGDIMSINGHVWISLGTCDDGSVVILHSTPADSRTGQPGGGVELSAIGTSEDCEAYNLADQYMSEYYPEWCERYPVKLADPETYFTFEGESAGHFTWDTTENSKGLTDPEKIQDMKPREVLEYIYTNTDKTEEDVE